MANKDLSKAKIAKNDEFYTQYSDIEKEVLAYLDFNANVFTGKTILLPCDDPEWSNFTKFFAQNFERFGIKKLISTSFAPDSKNYKTDYQPSLFETTNPKFDEVKTVKNGKIFTLTKDNTGDGKIDINDFDWEYLQGDGDFRSEEIKKLRDEADIIITNPPFSLFREFLQWIIKGNKQFLVIGNMNAITYKEVFPLIKENLMWLGCNNGDMSFQVPSYYEVKEVRFWQDESGQKWRSLGNICWFTNLDHGRRHQPLQLMTMEDNLKYNKKLKGMNEYPKYDNYDAIEVSYTDSIPSDYDGIMGVPITFLDKYNPDQFELLGSNRGIDQDPNKVYGKGSYINKIETFKRIFIKHKK